MALQVLGVAPLLALGSVALWIVPDLLGRQWSPVADVYPLIAFAYLVNAVFNMHASVLYLLRENARVATFHLAHTVVFGALAILLVREAGVVGYGVAETVAIAAYVVLHVQLARFFRPSYRSAAVRLVVLGPPIFAALLPPPWGLALFLSMPLLLLSPRERSQIRGYLRYLPRRTS